MTNFSKIMRSWTCRVLVSSTLRVFSMIGIRELFLPTWTRRMVETISPDGQDARKLFRDKLGHQLRCEPATSCY